MTFKVKKKIAVILVSVFCFFEYNCSHHDKESSKDNKVQTLRLATTTSAVGSGLLAKLVPVFEKQSDLKMVIIARGSGAALKIAKNGGADVVLVHSKKAEDLFIREGYGLNRVDVMHNDFVIVGPPDDPAQIEGESDIAIALQKIYRSKSLWASRGDDSGTYVRELILWDFVTLSPSGQWNIKTKKGMKASLFIASDKKAYILSGRGTFYFNEEKLNLKIMTQGDKRLINIYRLIAINPGKVEGVNFMGAMKFIDFIVSRNAQQLIKQHGLEFFSTPLFIPLAF